MDDKKYYFITVFERAKVSDKGWPDMGARRCWGFYSNKDTAIQALHENWTDMREYLYEYALIEEYYEGISNKCEYEQWFYYDENKKGFFEIDTPKELSHFCNWSIG